MAAEIATMLCMRHHDNVPLAAMLSKLLAFVGTDGLSPAGAVFATKLVRAGIDMCVDQWSGDNWNTLLRGTSIDVGVACLPCLENYEDSAVIPKAPVGSVGLAQSVAQRDSFADGGILDRDNDEWYTCADKGVRQSVYLDLLACPST